MQGTGRVCALALRGDQIRECAASCHGVGVIVAQGLLLPGECLAVELLCFGGPALGGGHLCEPEIDAVRVGMISAEDPLAVGENLEEHSLGFLVPALPADQPG